MAVNIRGIDIMRLVCLRDFLKTVIYIHDTYIREAGRMNS